MAVPALPAQQNASAAGTWPSRSRSLREEAAMCPRTMQKGTRVERRLVSTDRTERPFDPTLTQATNGPLLQYRGLKEVAAAIMAFPGQSASCHVITPRSSHVPSQFFRLRASPGPPVPPRGNWVTNVEADEIDLRHHGRIMIASIAHAACRNFTRRLPARQISLDPARCMNRLSGSLLGPVAYLDYLD